MPHPLDEQLDDLGVELGSRMLDELAAGVLRAPRGAVGTVVRHRPVRLQDAQHPGSERDVLAP
jgi:hypothetical protein